MNRKVNQFIEHLQQEQDENLTDKQKFVGISEIKLLQNYFVEKNRVKYLKMPEIQNQYQFVNCKKPGQSKEKKDHQVYFFIQVEYIQEKLHDAYIDQDLINEMLQEDNQTEKLFQNHQNTLTFKQNNQGNIDLIFPDMSQNNLSKDNYLDIITFDFDKKTSVNQRQQKLQNNCGVFQTQYKQLEEKEFIIIRDLFKIQLYKLDANDFYLEELFDQEIISFEDDKLFKDMFYIINKKNQIHQYSLQDQQQRKIYENQKYSNLFSIQQFRSISNNKEPNILFLQNLKEIYQLDTRQKILNNFVQNKENNSVYFGIQCLDSQYILSTTNKKILYYDIRNSKTPVFSIDHYQEENSPQIIQKFNTLKNQKLNIEEFLKDYQQISLQSSIDETNEVIGFQSPDKYGQSFMIQQELSSFKNNDRLKTTLSSFTDGCPFNYQKLDNSSKNYVQSLYSSSIINKKFKNRGIQGFIDPNTKDIYVFSTDNKGSLNIQIINNKQHVIIENIENQKKTLQNIKFDHILNFQEQKLFNKPQKKYKIDDELLEKIEKKPLIFDARKYFEKISQYGSTYQESPQSALLMPQTPSPLLSIQQKPEINLDFEDQIFNLIEDDIDMEQVVPESKQQDIYNNNTYKMDNTIQRHLKNLWDNK